jgi:hypothetical protein
MSITLVENPQGELFLVKVINMPIDKKVMAIGNSSGAGKTKLCITFKLERSFIVLIRFQWNDKNSKSLSLLVDWFGEIRSRVEDVLQRAKDALNAMRLFVFAHLQWILELLEASQKESDFFQRELCVCGLENEYGEDAVYSIFAAWKVQYSNLNKNSLNALFDGVIHALPPNMTVVYDEVAALKKGVSRTFLS